MCPPKLWWMLMVIPWALLWQKNSLKRSMNSVFFENQAWLKLAALLQIMVELCITKMAYLCSDGRVSIDFSYHCSQKENSLTQSCSSLNKTFLKSKKQQCPKRHFSNFELWIKAVWCYKLFICLIADVLWSSLLTFSWNRKMIRKQDFILIVHFKISHQSFQLFCSILH